MLLVAIVKGPNSDGYIERIVSLDDDTKDQIATLIKVSL